MRFDSLHFGVRSASSRLNLPYIYIGKPPALRRRPVNINTCTPYLYRLKTSPRKSGESAPGAPLPH